MKKIICITGLDGCGKSTQVELLCRWFETMGILYKHIRMQDIDVPSKIILKKSLIYLRKNNIKPQSDIVETVMLIEKYKINSIKIVDDNFFRTQSNDFLEKLIDLLSDVKISIRLSARPNDITEKRAELLGKLGVTVVAIGAESAHKESLKLFNKGLEIEESDNAIRYLNINSITCLVNFIMFNPIIDLEGIESNCNFIEKHMENCLFHRINSHLWIRSTDPIVEKLISMGLCEKKGFPYIECTYKSKEVAEIRYYFDLWCERNMEEYYQYADVLMAKGIRGNEDVYNKYKKILKKDIEVLKKIMEFSRSGILSREGERYIKTL